MKKTISILSCVVFTIFFYTKCTNPVSTTDGIIPGQFPVPQFQHVPSPALVVDDSISSYSNNLADSLVYEMQVAVKQLKNMELMPETKAVLSRCNYYRTFLKSSFKKSQGIHIDFIGDEHWVVQMGVSTDQIPNGVLSSQKEVRAVLDSAKYDAIGWEMSAVDSLTPEVFQKEQEYNQKLDGYPVTPQATPVFYRLKSSDSPDDAVFAYWLDHNNAKIVGLQDPVYWYFYNKTEAGSVFGEIRKFNSYLALARMVESMCKHGYKNGVVVLGSLHVADLVFLAKRLGIKMTVYDTCHDGIFEESMRTIR